MRTLNSRNDALHAGELVTGVDGLIVLNGEHMAPARCGKVGVHRADARIVETGTDGKGFLYLSVLGLHHEGACSVDDAFCAAVHGGSGIIGIYSVSGSLSQIYLHAVIINVVVDGSGSVASATHAGDEVIRIVAANLLLKLPFQFFRDYALHLGNNVWIWVRTHGRTYDIEGILWVAAPVAYGLRAGIAQRHVAGAHRVHLGSQHLHTLYVGMLALHIGGTHENLTLHVHQGAYRSGSHTVLSGSGFGNDAGLAHLLGHENLTDGVVDFVCTGMVQVLALQIELASVLLAHALGIIKR